MMEARQTEDLPAAAAAASASAAERLKAASWGQVCGRECSRVAAEGIAVLAVVIRFGSSPRNLLRSGPYQGDSLVAASEPHHPARSLQLAREIMHEQ
jgi:hypothetical protein